MNKTILVYLDGEVHPMIFSVGPRVVERYDTIEELTEDLYNKACELGVLNINHDDDQTIILCVSSRGNRLAFRAQVVDTACVG